MYRAGGLSGILAAIEIIGNQARLTKDKATLKRMETAPPASLTKKERTKIMAMATAQGVDWAQYYERQIREIFTDAMMNETPLEDVQKALRAVFESEVEPLTEADKTLELARMTPEQQRERDRKNRANARIYRRPQKELADWRAGKRKEPPWRLKARQNTTRMRTGWNRWFNAQVSARAAADPSVAAYKFSLGTAANHTDTCRSRAGMVVRKGTKAEAANRPPLHWGCKSRYIPMTKAMMKQEGIKPTTVKEMKGLPKPDSGFGGAKRLPT